MYGQQAGGTHHIWMLSCFNKCIGYLSIIENTISRRPSNIFVLEKVQIYWSSFEALLQKSSRKVGYEHTHIQVSFNGVAYWLFKKST